MTVAPTEGPRTAGGIARRHIAAGADLVLAAGGDGTVNEVAEGMLHSGVPLALLPFGTANVLAVEMKLGKLERVAQRLGDYQAHRISVGHVTCEGGKLARHFLLMAGVGLDAQVVYYVSAPLKQRTGKVAYWLAGGRILGRRLAEFQVDVEGRRRQCSFALLSKVRNYGGDFEIARRVSLYDDQFEVVLFEGRSAARYLKYLAGVMTNRLSGMKGVTVLHASQVDLSTPDNDEVYVQIDGEFLGRLPAAVSIVPDALTLLVPPEYKR